MIIFIMGQLGGTPGRLLVEQPLNVGYGDQWGSHPLPRFAETDQDFTNQQAVVIA